MPNNPDLPVVMDAENDGPPEQPAAPEQAGGQNIVNVEDDNAEAEAAVNLLEDQEENGGQVVEAPANNGGAEAGGCAVLLPCQPHPTKRKISNSSWMNNFNWLRDVTADGHTHQCKACGWTTCLPTNPKGSFINNKALRHIKKAHSQTPDAKRLKTAATKAGKAKVATTAQNLFQAMMKGQQYQAARKKTIAAALVKMRNSQAQWFTYSRARTPLSALDDPYFRKMLEDAIEYGRAGGKAATTATRRGNNSPYLTSSSIATYIEADLPWHSYLLFSLV